MAGLGAGLLGEIPELSDETRLLSDKLQAERPADRDATWAKDDASGTTRRGNAEPAPESKPGHLISRPARRSHRTGSGQFEFERSRASLWKPSM